MGANEVGIVLGDPAKFAGETEHSQQVALFAAVAQYVASFKASEYVGLVRLGDRLDMLHAIPNGGKRGNDKRSAMIAGANMKAEGQKPGVSDLFLPVAARGYHGFYIEMKAPGAGKWVKKRTGTGVALGIGEAGAIGERVWVSGESDVQIEWGKAVTREGYLYAVFHSWWAAFRALMWYLGFEHTKAWVLPLE